MSRIIRKERESHWYHVNGEPCHQVPYADPRKGMRATTLTDARKLNLLPSVTNVLAVKDKPMLTTWKVDQAIHSALRLTRNEGESESAFLSRIAEDAEREGIEAAAFGTLIHEQVESFNLTGAFSGTGEILEYVAPYEKYFRERVVEVLHVEHKVVKVEVGYAGRLDLHAIILDSEGKRRRAVLDIKTQRLKSKPKCNFYKEWEMQLAAYGDCLREPGDPLPALVSLVIPSDSPSPMEEKWWDNGLLALDAFHACHQIWCYDKDYTPKFQQP
ncbi:MAG: hypothetical protein QM627_10180 [Luteolibacter sp.]